MCIRDSYDPAHFNDRLLLGLKGTMSEAELHVLRARLIGGQRAKASRGELEMKLPIGLIQNPVGKVVLDPDLQVQAAVRTFFLKPFDGPARRRARCAASVSRACSSRVG